MQLNFNEISDGAKFEDLVVAYFEGLRNDGSNDIVLAEVMPTGIGIDGGRDILATMKVFDGVANFDRRWVVQCKFRSENISTKDINTINIPTLIHSYKASGYLLICKERPTSGLTNLFENLERNCQFGYRYIVWSGEQFIRKVEDEKTILDQFFRRRVGGRIKRKSKNL